MACVMCYPVEVRDARHPHISWFNLVYILKGPKLFKRILFQVLCSVACFFAEAVCRKLFPRWA